MGFLDAMPMPNAQIQKLGEELHERVAKHVAAVMASRQVVLEGLAKRFLEATGLRPDQVEMIEQRVDESKTTWHFQKLGTNSRQESITHQADGRPTVTFPADFTGFVKFPDGEVRHYERGIVKMVEMAERAQAYAEFAKSINQPVPAIPPVNTAHTKCDPNDGGHWRDPSDPTTCFCRALIFDGHIVRLRRSGLTPEEAVERAMKLIQPEESDDGIIPEPVHVKRQERK